MQSYLNGLLASAPPVPIWALALLWFVLLVCSFALLSRSQQLRAAQSHVTLPAHLEAQVHLSARLFARRLALAVAVFLLAYLFGGAASAFLAGGWCIATGVGTFSNLRSLLYFRALGMPGAAKGSIEYSAPLARRNQAAEMFAAAALCLLLGLVLAHLALLGAALFLAFAALGFLRKARASAPGRGSPGA